MTFIRSHMVSGLSAADPYGKVAAHRLRRNTGRWVIEGDLSSYFDTVHHQLLMKAVRRRIRDPRFMTLQWRIIKAGHVDAGLFRAASEGVPQGGVLSPLLSNVMLNEFDQYLHEHYLSGKARKDRWYLNNSIQRGRSTAVRENR